jgi:hypothetical protein
VCIRVFSFSSFTPLARDTQTRFNGSDTTLTQPTLGGRSHYQDLLLPRPEEQQCSPNSSREFSSPTGLLQRFPLRTSGYRRSRRRGPRMHFSCALKLRVPIPDVNGQRIGISPPGLFFLSGPTSPRHFGISRIANPRHKVPGCWKTPNAETPILRVRATCPSNNQRLLRNREIATRDLTCIWPLHSPTPIYRDAMVIEFHLRLEVNSVSRVQVADSLPLKSPSLRTFSWVCSTILVRNSPS